MTLSRKSFRSGLIIGFGTLFIATIGMLTVFSERFVVADILTLSNLVLFGVFLGAGFYIAGQVGDDRLPSLLINGAVTAGIIALILAVLAFVAAQVDLQSIFPNITPELVTLLSFEQENLLVGLLILVISGAIIGALGGWSTRLPENIYRIALMTVAMVVVLGILQEQIDDIITLPDALWAGILAMIGYGVAVWRGHTNLIRRLVEPALAGIGIGLLLGIIMLIAGANSETVPAILGDPPPDILASFILGRSAVGMLLLFAVFSGVLSIIGAALSSTSGSIHKLGISVLMGLLMLGVLNSTREMTLTAAIVIILITIIGQLLMRRTAAQANTLFERLNIGEQRTSQLLIGLAGLAFALVIPQLLTGYINNVVDLIGLFIMMGLGLNIVVGYAGLLDLGYVAFFAIGAYTTGVLTTPNVITCGGISPADIDPANIAAVCTGIATFWVAWPAAVLISGLAGVLLGIPVLRLRGDYLAIVTLGFGEIIRLVALSDLFKPYLGGAQGIINIPSPTIDLTGIAPRLSSSGIPLLAQLGDAFSQPISLSRPNEIYYLILAGILVTAFISYRLAHSRLGRAWRAMKEDEDVAQAMGINLVQTKLLAFSIGAAFSGVGGAIFGSYLKSIFPNSFTLLVSINVLSLIIIGGMGSIPGVIVGALVIFGLPEALREFEEYRLLMFGALLVLMMLLRPEGLLPPAPPRLEEEAEKAFAEEGSIA